MAPRLAPVAFGALALAGLAAALPLGLSLASHQSELHLTVPAPSPHEVVPAGGALLPVVAGPPELLGRINDPDPVQGPGLFLRTWEVTYGRRWERQVTWPVLSGPFDAEGTRWPCSFEVRLSPAFFDDGTPGGADVESFVDRVVRAQFPFSVMGLRFASVASTQLRVTPIAGALEIAGGITLADGPDPTHFNLKARLVLGERDGDLTSKLEGLTLTWRGKTRNDPLVALAGIFVDVDEQARGIVSRRMAGALSILKLPKEPMALFDGRPGDRVWMKLCNAPTARPEGVSVRLRVVARLAEPRLDARVPGPTRLEARPELPPPGDRPPTLEAAASAAAAHQALYLMWQSGELAAWGRRESVVSGMRGKLQDRVAFDLQAITARLPPSVAPGDSGGAFRVRFGDLELGQLDGMPGHAPGSRVVAHGDLLGRARVDAGRLGVSGTLGDLRVNCVETQTDGLLIKPCFSDVVPVLRETGLSSEGLPLDLPLPDRLLRVSLVLGTDLVISDLSGEVVGSPPQLLLKGDARLVKRGP